ncbi:MAG TPA: hypothetical protein VFD71_05900, partial [Planctomycetota bacterium]|nr:hypothetical protein [Planctomycetota bacterium]
REEMTRAEILGRRTRVGTMASSSIASCRILGVAAAAMLAGCATIGLRCAMANVQRRYVELTRTLEAGGNFASRDAAIELRRALEARAVAVDSPYAGEPEYRRLLQEAVQSTDEVRKVAERFDREALSTLRSRVSVHCDACHSKYRRS